MNNKEKLVISKLLKIAENQQKIIIRLAQEVDAGHDPEIDYINNRLIAVVAANLGLQNVSSDTSRIAGTPPAGSSDGHFNEKQPDHFVSNVSGVPADKQQHFTQAVGAQVQAQKPGLNLTIFFK